MRNIKRVGPYADVIDAPGPEGPATRVMLGLRQSTVDLYARLGIKTFISQYYGIVQDGIVLAGHLYKGLQRPLELDGDMSADANVLIYAWRPSLDCEWEGSPQEGSVVFFPAPPGRTFVVLARIEQPNGSGVFASIDRFNWIEEDPQLPEAPRDWRTRYKETLWNRQ